MTDLYCSTCKSEHPASEPPQDYLNTYEHCGTSWESVWCCGCDDECPVCGHDIEATASEINEDDNA